MDERLSPRERRQVANSFRLMPDRLRERIMARNYKRFFVAFYEAFDAVEPDRYDAKTGAVVGGGGPDHRIRMEAVKLYAEIAGLKGTESRIIFQLNTTLGVKNESELREMVELGKRFAASRNGDGQSPEALWPRVAQLAEMIAPRMSEAEVRSHAERLLALCGSGSAAEVIEGANGNADETNINGV